MEGCDLKNLHIAFIKQYFDEEFSYAHGANSEDFKIHKVKNILSKEKWDAIMTEANDFTIRNVGLNI